MSRVKLPTSIGNVKIDQFLQASDNEYSDGDSEELLLELFKSKDSHKKRVDLLSSNPEWRLRYHLDYDRENLLNWYPFKKGGALLEVGAGCGALTSVFLRGCSRVDALDISPRRSLINAYRHHTAENLNIIVSNVENFKNYEAYDYVTSIGVLEYAGRFINSADPFRDFLKQLYKLLKPGGILILAIENQLGIKYWSGSSEDHLGKQVFTGIEDYPNSQGIRTFGRFELEELLKECSFKKTDFYYPLPDYKLPIDVYSDKYIPGEGAVLSSDLFPTPNPDKHREFLIDEGLAMQVISRNKLFPYFANSFLVFAQKEY